MRLIVSHRVHGQFGLLEAYAAAKAAGRKNDGLIPAVELIIRWAQTNHAEWFYRYQHAQPAVPQTEAVKPAAKVVQLRPPGRPEPDQPRWRPTF